MDAIPNEVKVLFDRTSEFFWIGQPLFDVYPTDVLQEINTRWKGVFSSILPFAREFIAHPPFKTRSEQSVLNVIHPDLEPESPGIYPYWLGSYFPIVGETFQ